MQALSVFVLVIKPGIFIESQNHIIFLSWKGLLQTIQSSSPVMSRDTHRGQRPQRPVQPDHEHLSTGIVFSCPRSMQDYKVSHQLWIPTQEGSAIRIDSQVPMQPSPLGITPGKHAAKYSSEKHLREVSVSGWGTFDEANG